MRPCRQVADLRKVWLDAELGSSEVRALESLLVLLARKADEAADSPSG
jgi:hypothetical protein